MIFDLLKLINLKSNKYSITFIATMKRKILALLIVLSGKVAYSVMSFKNDSLPNDTVQHHKLSAGIKGGVIFSTLQWYNPVASSCSSVMKEQTNISSAFGIEANYHFKKGIYVAPALLFTSKYNSFSVYSDNFISPPVYHIIYQYDLLYSLRYLELHMPVKYRKNIGRFFVQGAAGPYIAFRTNANVIYNKYYIECTAVGNYSNWQTVFDPSDVKGNSFHYALHQIKALDAGMVFAAGGGINIFHGNIFVEAMATKGMINVLKKSYVDNDLSENYHYVNNSPGKREYETYNRMFLIQVGYNYIIKK